MRRGLEALLIAAAVLPCAAAPPVSGGGILVASDDRYRGISLSGGKPDARLTLALDDDSGVYAGAALTGPAHHAGSIVYAGYGAELANGWRWEAGATRQTAHGRNAEGYAGILGERWSLRLALSPDYFGSGRRSAYVEADAHWPLASAWRLAAHAGRLQTAGGGRSDGRVAVVLQAAGADWQLGVASVGRGGPRPAAYEASRTAVVAAAAWSF